MGFVEEFKVSSCGAQPPTELILDESRKESEGQSIMHALFDLVALKNDIYW